VQFHKYFDANYPGLLVDLNVLICYSEAIGLCIYRHL